MNAEEAQLILQCRRPRGQDDHDPAISEALALAGGDAACLESLRREESLDAAIGERLRSVVPPADLLRKIMVGVKVARPRRWWTRPAWLAAAAGLAVAAPLAVKFWPDAAPQVPAFASITLPGFRAATTQKLNEGPQLTKLASMDAVRAHLASHTKTKECCVPGGLCQCPGGTIGCEVFAWNGLEVTLICFDAGQHGVVHLFTVDAVALAQHPGGPEFQIENGWRTCSWISGDRLLLLAGGEKETSREVLEALRQ